MRGVELQEQRVQGGGIMTVARFRPGRMPADGGDWHEAVHRAAFMADVDRLLERARQRPELIAQSPGAGYVINTGASAIALVAATAKTIMYVNAGASSNIDLCELCVGFDGVTASAVPALVEWTFSTKASNSVPGTGSTAFTPLQSRGWPTSASGNAGANTCTSEPTVQVSHRQWLVTPNGGLLIMQFPLGREPTGISSGAAISGIQVACRVTAPAVVNVRGYAEWEE